MDIQAAPSRCYAHLCYVLKVPDFMISIQHGKFDE